MTATSRSTAGAWNGEGLAHEAFIFDDDEAMRARVIPFIEEGRAQGQPSIVVASEEVCTLLADRLGRTAVSWCCSRTPSGSGRGVADAGDLPGQHDAAARGGPTVAPGRPADVADPRRGEVWSRFEAVANDAFADYPYYSLCLHDRRQLSPELVADALRTHPLMWDGDDVVRSPAYQPTAAFLRSVEPPGPSARRAGTPRS